MKKVVFFVVAISCVLAAVTYAESVPTAVNKAFLEGRYGYVVSESERLIDGGSYSRDELYYLKGLSQLKLGKFSDARGSFGQVITRYPNSNRAFDAYIGIGDAYYLEGNLKEAARFYADAAKKYPSHRNVAVAPSRIKSCAGSPGLSDLPDQYAQKLQNTSSSLQSNITSNVERAVTAVKQNFVSANVTSRSFIPSIGTSSVQVGAFKNMDNASRLAGTLTKKGYDAYVDKTVASGSVFYRVQVGRFASQDDAQRMAVRLNILGYKTKICAHDL